MILSKLATKLAWSNERGPGEAGRPKKAKRLDGRPVAAIYLLLGPVLPSEWQHKRAFDASLKSIKRTLSLSDYYGLQIIPNANNALSK